MVSTSPPPPNAVNDEPPAYDTGAASQLDELSMSLVAQLSSCELLVSLVPPTQPQPLGEKLTGRRAPLDLCLVIDVSGSMNTEAPVPGEQDKNETTGLSVLDVVKHATRTIIESMDDGDRIAIVTFSDSAEVITHLTPTTKENRARVWNQVNGLRTKGMTNLWDGLKAGMNVITGASRASEGSSSPKTPKGSTPLASPTTSTFSKRTSFLSSIGLGKKKQAPALPPPDKAPPSSDSKPPVSPSTADHQSHDSRQRLSAVLILTDGQPNVEPPRGHIPMLKSYLDALPADSPKFTISTFGFGYSLDSRLLDEIADLGQGTYGFIPDSGMVGTVFVHAVANLMTTWATACILDVEVVMEDPSAEAKVNVLGSLPVTSSSWGASIQVGDIQYGQSREVVVQLPVECFGPNAKHVTNITARYLPHTRATHGSPLHIKQTLGPSYEVDSSVMLQHEVYRLSFIRAVSELFQKTDRGSNSPPSGTQFEQALVAHTSNPLLKDHGPSTALTSDITSQVVLGLQSEHWSRWGMHYIPSLARSHQRQQCSNFKDPGLQMYGRDSSLFTSTRDAIDQTFDSLPPPTPSLKDRNVYRPGKSAPATYAPLSSMSKYRSSSAPCFAGWCLVDTGDGRPTKVSDLHRGSVIRASSGMARVAAVLRTVCPMGVTDLCLIGRLAVTPWHPVKFGDSWVFPAKVCEPEPVACDYVYSVLLEPSTDPGMHALNVEGVWCVTLGHGRTDPVRAHPFLGDYARVVESLSRMEGYHSTRGVVDGTGVVRDEETGLVCGFKKLGINEDSSAMVPGVPLQYIACEA